MAFKILKPVFGVGILLTMLTGCSLPTFDFRFDTNKAEVSLYPSDIKKPVQVEEESQ